MGLDSFLKVSKYVSNYDFSTDSDKESYKKVLAAINLKPEDVDEGSPSMTINVNVCYWRKANAIHNYFVNNCAEGRDECQEIYVTREELEKLVEACEAALKGDPEDNLPTTSGFFFGSTEYDEYYKQDLEFTITQINKILAKFDDSYSFIYQASW
jgi:hypothetical protein